jgi:hypothetical protein
MSLSSAVIPALVVVSCGLLICFLLLLVTCCHRRTAFQRFREAETRETETEEKRTAAGTTEERLG